MADASFNAIGDGENAHPADRMMRRIQTDMRLIRKVMRERDKFAEVLQVRYNDQSGSVNQAQAMDGEDFRRHGENYSWVYLRYIMAQVAGEPLYIRSDRNQGSERDDLPSDAVSGSWVDETMTRAAFEADLENELNELAKAVAAYGCGAMVRGYRDGAERQEAIRQAAMDHHGVIKEVIEEGDTEAKEGQDHRSIAFHLRDATKNEALTVEQVEKMLERAKSHDQMFIVEQKKAALRKKDDAPAHAFDWRLADSNVWCKFRSVGEDVVFDMSTHDPREHAYRAEKVMVPLEQFRKDTTYSHSARHHPDLQGAGNRTKSMLADDDQPRSMHGENLKQMFAEKMVETWRVWIRRPQMRSGGVRRIVSPELPGMWIEADESYPYIRKQMVEIEEGIVIPGPEHGKPLFKNWWPIEICAPLTGPMKVPETQLGIPLISPMWQQQIEINQYAAIAHGKNKRAVRIWLGDLTAIADEKQRDLIQNAASKGIDGTFAWITPAMGRKVDEMVAGLSFRDNAPEVEQTKDRQIQTFARIGRFPEPAMGLVGTSGTLGQDEAAVSQGEEEMQLILKPIEDCAANVVRDFAAMIREYYSEEKLRKMLGARGAKTILEYRQTALDGDRFTIMLGARSRKMKIVDRKQVMETIQLGSEVFVDDIGAPIYDMRPMYEALLRSQNLGGLEPLKNFQEDPRYAQVLQLFDAMAKTIQDIQKSLGIDKDNKAGSANATPGPEGQLTPSGQAPQTGTLNAGARRDTVAV